MYKAILNLFFFVLAFFSPTQVAKTMFRAGAPPGSNQPFGGSGLSQPTTPGFGTSGFLSNTGPAFSSFSQPDQAKQWLAQNTGWPGQSDPAFLQGHTTPLPVSYASSSTSPDHKKSPAIASGKPSTPSTGPSRTGPPLALFPQKNPPSKTNSTPPPSAPKRAKSPSPKPASRWSTNPLPPQAFPAASSPTQAHAQRSHWTDKPPLKSFSVPALPQFSPYPENVLPIHNDVPSEDETQTVIPADQTHPPSPLSAAGPGAPEPEPLGALSPMFDHNDPSLPGDPIERRPGVSSFVAIAGVPLDSLDEETTTEEKGPPVSTSPMPSPLAIIEPRSTPPDSTPIPPPPEHLAKQASDEEDVDLPEKVASTVNGFSPDATALKSPRPNLTIDPLATTRPLDYREADTESSDSSGKSLNSLASRPVTGRASPAKHPLGKPPASPASRSKGRRLSIKAAASPGSRNRTASLSLTIPGKNGRPSTPVHLEITIGEDSDSSEEKPSPTRQRPRSSSARNRRDADPAFPSVTTASTPPLTLDAFKPEVLAQLQPEVYSRKGVGESSPVLSEGPALSTQPPGLTYSSDDQPPKAPPSTPEAQGVTTDIIGDHDLQDEQSPLTFVHERLRPLAKDEADDSSSSSSSSSSPEKALTSKLPIKKTSGRPEDQPSPGGNSDFLDGVSSLTSPDSDSGLDGFDDPIPTADSSESLDRSFDQDNRRRPSSDEQSGKKPTADEKKRRKKPKPPTPTGGKPSTNKEALETWKKFFLSNKTAFGAGIGGVTGLIMLISGINKTPPDPLDDLSEQERAARIKRWLKRGGSALLLVSLTALLLRYNLKPQKKPASS